MLGVKLISISTMPVLCISVSLNFFQLSYHVSSSVSTLIKAFKVFINTTVCLYFLEIPYLLFVVIFVHIIVIPWVTHFYCHKK